MAGTHTRGATDRMVAAKDGRLRYFTGKPCLKGHVAERYTKSGACCECQALGVQEYNKRIRATIAAALEG